MSTKFRAAASTITPLSHPCAPRLALYRAVAVTYDNVGCKLGKTELFYAISHDAEAYITIDDLVDGDMLDLLHEDDERNSTRTKVVMGRALKDSWEVIATRWL